MIYAATIAIASESVEEIFASLGIDPINAKITIQNRQGSGIAGIQLSQDAEGSSLGPYIGITEVYTAGSEIYAQDTIYTDKDPVYLYNGYGGSISVMVAVYPTYEGNE
jgi:hypothetical protein